MKKELMTLSDLLRDTADFFDFGSDMATTASVIIQNMAFHADKWKWEDFDKGLELIDRYVKFRPDHHYLAWAYTEARMIIDGHFQSQMEEQAIHHEW